MRRPWLETEIRAVGILYPHVRTEDVAAILGRPTSGVYQCAARFGFSKSEAFRASTLSGRNVKGHAPHGARTRFQKGLVPRNKGLRRPGYAPGRMRETQFKKGGFPINRDPDYYVIGALRVNADGYIDMRVSFEPGANGWRALHRILWEDQHGPVPHGHVVVFRDGDPLNCWHTNFELISRGELCRRNSIHNLPAPLRNTIQLLGQLKRRIRERHQSSEGTTIRNARGAAGQGTPDGPGSRKDGRERGPGDRRLRARRSRNGPSYGRANRQRFPAAAGTARPDGTGKRSAAAGQGIRAQVNGDSVPHAGSK